MTRIITEILTIFLLACFSTAAIAAPISNHFQTQCSFKVPMRSNVLFVQAGEVVDFQDVMDQGAGNPNVPYCTLTLGNEAYNQIAATGAFTFTSGTHEFTDATVTDPSQDFFATPGVSIHFFAGSSPSPFIGAHCFVPGHTQSLVPFGLSDVEQELSRNCPQNYHVSVEVVSEPGFNIAKRVVSKKSVSKKKSKKLPKIR